MADDPKDPTPPPASDPIPAPEPVVVQPDPERHVFLEGSMLSIEDIGIEHPRLRRITYGDANYEHVSDHESGCWVYRRM